ncbi:polysaccharide deacetylase family protein [Kushneria phosphatilytica]|uniref:Polysaccharide deacetylase family protein n=1 Tax=Kushneria phosphatilytica TaxID=657387 RepID=A0A1S1NRW5_9GAMM|nr:polysaccharide deacetylase family protein [Kushneria phosphatilytica]OHV07638.1 polysaccharide deacetylase [Kushneria phosphatilytica]QEL10128.1 polysaccharide deacetylase family protein [Kushneria phosphatilytica]
MSTGLRHHGRFDYRPIIDRDHWRWPNETGLAVYIGFNLEHFAFGSGRGAGIAPPAPEGEPDVLNYGWREYGNRVGAWRCLELFERLGLPVGAIANTAILDHCPELLDAFHARGDEIIAHGHTNAERQGQLAFEDERALIERCRERLHARYGRAPGGWLSPWISESEHTPDLLAESGFDYTLNWAHDERPVPLSTRHGTLWSIPYPQELNDIPSIVPHRISMTEFVTMARDQCDELLEQSRHQPLVMGIALHPYIVGQPFRLPQLRLLLEHLANYRDRGLLWWSTPGEIHHHVTELGSR